MKQIYLHIGHKKTGSSALQNFFVNHPEILRDNSILYPAPESLVKAGRENKITSGNGRNISKQLTKLSKPLTKDILFSSEFIFRELTDKNCLHEISRQANRLDAQLTLICYTRDFFSFSFSSWGQYIKRDRGTLEYTDFMQKRTLNEFYKNFKSLIESTNENKVPLKVYNYDRHKRNLPAHFMAFGLGCDVDVGAIQKSDTPTNRSLTVAEYELQRLFNIYYQNSSSHFVSDPFVESLPLIKSETPFFTRNQYEQILIRHERAIGEVNEHLDVSERILIQPYEDLLNIFSNDHNNLFAYTADQLEVIVKSISRELNKTPDYSKASLKKLIKIRIKEKAARLLKRTE